ncbi:AP-4 complex subunit mu-1 [Hordeum vulgare]|nr:AP-4 complex subunit mu-1 [Hordeum vulgare]
MARPGPISKHVSAGHAVPGPFTTGRVVPCRAGPFRQMFDDQDLGFFTNFLGIFIFVLVIAYHFVMADPKYEN